MFGICTVLLASLALGPSPAAPSPAPLIQPAKQGPRVTATLVSENQALVPGQTNWLGVNFTITKGWHIYWPGLNDTGMAPTLEIKAPQGFTVGELSWPTPIRHVAPGEILDHIYENSVLVMVPVEVPKDAKPGPASFTVDCKWLVCADVCLPEKSTIALTVPVAAADQKPKASPSAKLFQAARLRVPTPLKKDSETTARIDHRTLVIESPGAAKLEFMPREGSPPMPHLFREGESTTGKLVIAFEPADPKAHIKGTIEVTPKGKKEPAFYSVDLEVPHE